MNKAIEMIKWLRLRRIAEKIAVAWLAYGGLIYGTYVFTYDYLYYNLYYEYNLTTEEMLEKVVGKYHNNRPDMKDADTISMARRCDGYFGQVYAKRSPDRRKIERLCGEAQKEYSLLDTESL